MLIMGHGHETLRNVSFTSPIEEAFLTKSQVGRDVSTFVVKRFKREYIRLGFDVRLNGLRLVFFAF